MFTGIFNALFGCSHRNYSFPMTVKRGTRSPAASVTGTYVVCLKCGKEFPYDWREMKIVAANGNASGAITAPVESYAGK